MTVQARRIAAIPRRSSVETWRAICGLLAQPGSSARTELEAATGLAASLIAEEYTRDAPIIVSGTGPQLRIYTLHGDDAIEADLDEETGFAFDPTEATGACRSPCGVDDLEDAIEGLAASDRINAREMTSGPTGERSATTTGTPIIDLSELERS